MPRQTPVVLLVQPLRDDGGRMYAEFMRHRGLTSILTSNASDAFDRAREADVIVTGIVLSPESDGIELITRLRDDAHTKHTPIIVLTACAWQSARDQAQQAGCNAFLTKPCLPESLLVEVNRQLAGSKLRAVRAAAAKADMRAAPRARIHRRRKP